MKSNGEGQKRVTAYASVWAYTLTLAGPSFAISLDIQLFQGRLKRHLILLFFLFLLILLLLLLLLLRRVTGSRARRCSRRTRLCFLALLTT